MKKVLHVVKFFKIGGLEKVLYTLCTKKSEEIEQSVLVIWQEGMLAHKARECGVDVKSLENKKNKFNKASIFLKIAKHFLINKIDIIHCHDSYSLFYCVLLGKLFNKKIIFTKHGFEKKLKIFLFKKTK